MCILLSVTMYCGKGIQNLCACTVDGVTHHVSQSYFLSEINRFSRSQQTGKSIP